MIDRVVEYMLKRPALAWLIAIALGLLLSYGMANIGEPRAVWIWRDVFNLI